MFLNRKLVYVIYNILKIKLQILNKFKKVKTFNNKLLK